MLLHFSIFWDAVQFCKRPSRSIFSLASNSSSLVLLCKIWGVSKSLKSFMSAPRIRKDQHQFVENSGSSKWDHYMMRSMQYKMLMLNMCPFGGNGRIMLVHKTKIVTFPIYGYVAHIMCAISSSNTADLFCNCCHGSFKTSNSKIYRSIVLPASLLLSSLVRKGLEFFAL